MAIGERIRFIRNLRGMTQKYLGMAVGFPERAADVRMAQYESGTRTPKADLTNEIAHVLDVSPSALDVPEIDTDIGLMHTFFAIEDLYAIKIGEINGEVCLRLDKTDFNKWYRMLERFRPWLEEKQRLERGEITKEEYDQWRYTYPEIPVARNRAALDALRIKEKEAEATK